TFADPDQVYPDKAVVTPAKPADHTQMDVFIDETDATYLMDRGYLDYGKYDNYCKLGIRFVSRLKNNALIEEVEELPVAARSNILRDEKVILGKGKKRMTNRFDLSAAEIGDLYRSRWEIETFFRWVKQHLKLTRFYGTSEQAVINQIWICLIAYCLDLLIKLDLETNKTLSELVDILKTLLWKPWDNFIAAVI
ncbi:transposase, partial [Paenibacillus alginolyticus]|uniref:transposase n=1 Tax=Paenibacillus alginolyticus TaxID=59839 RepID=UPI0022852C47